MARPVLLNSCARAATAAEARFRLDYPLAPARATRVIALDPAAAEVVAASAAAEGWHHARFSVVSAGPAGTAADGLELTEVSGRCSPLAAELDGVDAVVLVAATGAGAEAAAMIGAACTVRGIMTAGLVLTPDAEVTPALAALRPHARVLLVPADGEDLIELLRAVRA